LAATLRGAGRGARAAAELSRRIASRSATVPGRVRLAFEQIAQFSTTRP
jgi:hypothetical protein